MSGLNPKVISHGGARPGAGRKSIYQLSEVERKRVIKAMRRMERQKRKSMGTVLAEMVFDEKDPRRQSVGLQIFMRDVLAKSSHQEIDVRKTDGPGVYLPEQRPDPAKIVELKKKTAVV